MKNLLHTLAPAVFLLGLTQYASGQAFDAYFSAGEQLLTNSQLGDATSAFDVLKLTDGFRFGFRMSINYKERFGHEVGYAYNRMHLHDVSTSPVSDIGGMAAHQGIYDFLAYATKEGSRIRPFAAGGVQFTNFVPPGSSAAQGGGQTKFGINYGAGVKFKITSMFGIRFDFRQYWMGKPGFGLPGISGHLTLNEISAGFGVVI